MGGNNIAKKDYLSSLSQHTLEEIIHKLKLSNRLPIWYDKKDCVKLLMKEVTVAEIDTVLDKIKRKRVYKKA